MFKRTLATSIMALGLLSPNDYCSTNQAQRSEYAPCNGVVLSAETQGLAIRVEPRAKKRGAVGSFIDETTEERNQRTSNH
jgi:hypothetical protein